MFVRLKLYECGWRYVECFVPLYRGCFFLPGVSGMPVFVEIPEIILHRNAFI